MKTSAINAALVVIIGLSWAGMAQGVERTVALSVDGMTCVSCPYMVEQSLKRLDGVVDARASMGTDAAEVTFDDDRVSVEALASATANAGFPSSVQGVTDHEG
ncbi:cation transporter [Aquisalimonas lutea]|uniref:cation transporter n=1 Tax=Aquisalimonas lutea TaxID=1327750 RepID=UPI0025B29700|nr:cation transporter [Aquisalimonas lutea]MDN3519266.1 cation transporter [Aquisalimonas lutea]